MEIVGQTFSLAVASDTIDTIANATELYRRWLLVESDIPSPIKTDKEQIFLKVKLILILLFKSRINSHTLFRKSSIIILSSSSLKRVKKGRQLDER